jgi:hypothetical protein
MIEKSSFIFLFLFCVLHLHNKMHYLYTVQIGEPKAKANDTEGSVLFKVIGTRRTIFVKLGLLFLLNVFLLLIC